jgi:hypothetical protein
LRTASVLVLNGAAETGCGSLEEANRVDPGVREFREQTVVDESHRITHRRDDTPSEEGDGTWASTEERPETPDQALSLDREHPEDATRPTDMAREGANAQAKGFHQALIVVAEGWQADLALTEKR